MSLAGTAAITELWAKCKAWFATKATASTTATTASIQLKNSADTALGSAATIPAATTTAAGVMTADDKTKLNGIASGATANSASSTTPKMDGTAAVGSESAFARGDHVHPTDTSRQATLVSGTNIKTVGSQSLLGSGNLTVANIGAAASSHAHGNITSGGDITATAPTIASGDCLVINDDSASKITNGPAFGTSTTTYLRNDGTWGTPAGTSYSDFTGATSSAAGTHGLVPAPAANSGNARIITDGGAWRNVMLGYSATQSTFELEIYAQDGSTTSTKKTLSGTVSLPMASATSLATTAGIMSYADKSKLDGIASGAQANQNAFSNVKVGSTTIEADTTTDTIEIVAGSNVTLTPDATNDKLTIAATNTDANVSQVATSSNSGYPILFKNSANPTGETAQVRYGVSTFGVVVPQINPSTGNIISTLFNGYTLADACAKGVDTSIGAGSTSTNLPTTQAVAQYVADAQVGAATFQGTLVAPNPGGDGDTTWDEADIEAVSYKKGWYWVCQTAGTYTGKVLEVGDMLFCVSDKDGTYKAADFTAVQNNIVEMTTDEVDAICV